MAVSDRPSPGGDSDAPTPAANHATHPPHGRHAKTHHSVLLLVLPAVAVVAVVAFLAAFLGHQPSPSSGPPPTAAPRSAARTAPDSATPAVDAHTTAAVAACRQAWDAQTPVLQAADRSLAQWQTHVGAMNELVAGKITYAQASRFWARTRIGAKHRVRVFEREDRVLRNDPLSCTAPAGASNSSVAAATLATCARGVRVRNETLTSARRAIRTWRHHIGDMEMLRDGQMSPSTAEQMWIMMWHRGQRQIDDYHALADQAATQHC